MADDECRECNYWGTGHCRLHRPIREIGDYDGMEHDMAAFGEAYIRVVKP